MPDVGGCGCAVRTSLMTICACLVVMNHSAFRTSGRSVQLNDRCISFPWLSWIDADRVDTNSTRPVPQYFGRKVRQFVFSDVIWGTVNQENLIERFEYVLRSCYDANCRSECLTGELISNGEHFVDATIAERIAQIVYRQTHWDHWIDLAHPRSGSKA